MAEPQGLPRRFARWAVRRFYRRIEIVDGDRIPAEGAVLLCANHANSLVDSVIVGITARRPVRFMARAALFDVRGLGALMRALGMVPAFRGMDDQKQVRRNLDSLQTGAGVLVEGHAMGIFPEGMSTDEMHLVKVRTGAARMALQAVEDGTPEVRVAPIGIAYEDKERFRSNVLVRVAEPLDATRFLAAEDGNVPRARRALTAELDARLKSVVIHLENPEWTPWLDDLEVLVPETAGSADDRPPDATGALWQRKRMADAINHFWSSDRPRAEAAAAAIADYRENVRSAGLTIDADVLRLSGAGVVATLTGRLAWLAAMFVPALLATIHFIVPYFLVRWIDGRVRDAETGRTTIATHKLMYGIPVYALWHAGFITAVWFAVDPRVAIVWMIVAPFLGALALRYWRRARRTFRLILSEVRILADPGGWRALRKQRATIRDTLAAMAAEFEKVQPPSAPPG